MDEGAMPHINLPAGLAAPRGPMAPRPAIAGPLSELGEVLRRGPSTLTKAERELIRTYVSSENDYRYCQRIHGAIATYYLGGDEVLGAFCEANSLSAEVSPKLKALLNLAGKVQQSGKSVTPEDIILARNQGAIELEIHNTVLIAATFCMMNRYVDGLAAWAPEGDDFYRKRAAELAVHGYIGSPGC